MQGKFKGALIQYCPFEHGFFFKFSRGRINYPTYWLREHLFKLATKFQGRNSFHCTLFILKFQICLGVKSLDFLLGWETSSPPMWGYRHKDILKQMGGGGGSATDSHW